MGKQRQDRVCDGKVRHHNREGAMIALKRARKRDRDHPDKMKPGEWRAYKCPICHGWHIGHARTDIAVAQFIDTLKSMGRF